MRNAISAQMLQDQRGDAVVVAAEMMTAGQAYRAQRRAGCSGARGFVVIAVNAQGANCAHALQLRLDRRAIFGARRQPVGQMELEYRALAEAEHRCEAYARARRRWQPID